MEIWKDMHGYEDRYEISSLGRIGIKERIGFHPKNKHGNPHKFKVIPKMISQRLDRYGYSTCQISNSFGAKNLTVHRLVAKTFLRDKYFPGAQVNHKNGIRNDNRLSNLEWCTGKENVLHSYKIGRKVLSGEENGASKVSENEVLNIRKLYSSGMKQKEIAGKFNITQSNVSAIIRRKSWPNI